MSTRARSNRGSNHRPSENAMPVSSAEFRNKHARESDDIILRFYETSGEDTKAVISLSETFKSAEETDLMENRASKTFIHDKTIEMPISKHEIKTVKMIMQA